MGPVVPHSVCLAQILSPEKSWVTVTSTDVRCRFPGVGLIDFGGSPDGSGGRLGTRVAVREPLWHELKPWSI